MAVKKGLGRGLDALLGDFTETPPEGVQEIDIRLIDTNADQPRKAFDEDKLKELSASISLHGMVQPIIVRKKSSRYTIVAGERRFRAARMAGRDTVPIIVKELEPAQVMEIALIENLQREDLNPVEEAAAIRFLMQQHDLTQEEVSKRLSKSRPAIANSLRLLTLGDDIQNYVREGKLSAGHARALVPIKNVDAQRALANAIVEKQLSVRDAEDMARQEIAREEADRPHGEAIPTAKQQKEEPQLSGALYEAQEQLRNHLGTKVAISGNEKRGKLIIDYYSRDMLEGLYELLMRE